MALMGGALQSFLERDYKTGTFSVALIVVLLGYLAKTAV